MNMCVLLALGRERERVCSIGSSRWMIRVTEQSINHANKLLMAVLLQCLNQDTGRKCLCCNVRVRRCSTFQLRDENLNPNVKFRLSVCSRKIYNEQQLHASSQPILLCLDRDPRWNHARFLPVITWMLLKLGPKHLMHWSWIMLAQASNQRFYHACHQSVPSLERKQVNHITFGLREGFRSSNVIFSNCCLRQ